MAGIGIVTNPLARRNRARPRTSRRLALLVGQDGEVAEAATPEELARALERFRRAEVDLLAVNGGDGTVRRVLGAMTEAWGSAPFPRVALLPGGALSTLAAGHGARGSPERVLRRIVARRRAGRPLRTVERDLLRVEADGDAPLHGFHLGTGAVVAFLDALAAGRGPSRGRAARLLVRAAASTLVGGPFARALGRRERLRVLADGEEWPQPAYLAVLAGSVPEVGLGFEPLARSTEQPGFFHAVGVTASPARLALGLPAVWLGRPWRRRVAMDAVARTLVLEPEAPPLRFALDGDLLLAGRRVEVTTGPAVQVVVGLGDGALTVSAPAG